MSLSGKEPMPSQNPPCDVCGCASAHILYKKEDGTQIARCASCGLLYVFPQRLGDAELSSYYQGTRLVSARKDVKIKHLHSPLALLALREWYGYKTAHAAHSSLKLLAWAAGPVLVRNIPPFTGEGKILDIGCGNGAYLAILKSLGWKTYGIEVNTQDCEVARSLGIEVYCRGLEELHLPARSFDVVRMVHVLEHLSSPLAIFKEIKRIIKPGGTLYVEVPNEKSFAGACFKENYLAAGSHLYGFSLSTLTLLCEKAGFSVGKVRYKSSKGVTLTSLQYAAGKRLAFLFRNKMYKGLILGLVVPPLRFLLNAARAGDAVALEIRDNPAVALDKSVAR